MTRIDDVMYEDDAFIAEQAKEDRDYDEMMTKSQEEDLLAAQEKERQFKSKAEERRFKFQNQLREVMLQSGLNEIDSDSGIDHGEPALQVFCESLVEESLAQEGEFSNHEESQMTETELQNDVEEGMREWSQEYDYHIQNPPKEGDILTTLESDTKVLLVVELVDGSSPFIYGRAYVPEVVGSVLGWFLQSGDSQNFHGWKCIILPKARTELIRKYGLQSETIEVKSLKIIRLSQSGKSLLCEVHKYGDEVEAEVGVQEIETGQAVVPASVLEDAIQDVKLPDSEDQAVADEIQPQSVEEPQPEVGVLSNDSPKEE